MGFLELKYNGRNYTNATEINRILRQENFYWLIDSEVDDAIVEILKNTLIWHSGIYISGNWKFGIFKNGGFYGNWENGIFESGHFDGNWNSGINLTKNNLNL